MIGDTNAHPSQAVERRRWVRQTCHAGAPIGPVVAYTQGNLAAQAVHNLSAGGLCLVTDRKPGEKLSIEVYNLRSKFACTLAARVVSTIEHSSGCFLVGTAFDRELSADELNRLVARTNVTAPPQN